MPDLMHIPLNEEDTKRLYARFYPDLGGRVEFEIREKQPCDCPPRPCMPDCWETLDEFTVPGTIIKKLAAQNYATKYMRAVEDAIGEQYTEIREEAQEDHHA